MPEGWRRTSLDEFRLVRGRALRLAIVSSVALGIVFQLARQEPSADTAAKVMLGAGWPLMPSALVLTILAPRFRTVLSLPAALVTLGVLLVAVRTFPSSGWLLLGGGLALGGALGAWLWFGWAPAPSLRAAPSHPLRLAMMGLHIGLVLTGIGLILVL